MLYISCFIWKESLGALDAIDPAVTRSFHRSAGLVDCDTEEVVGSKPREPHFVRKIAKLVVDKICIMIVVLSFAFFLLAVC